MPLEELRWWSEFQYLEPFKAIFDEFENDGFSILPFRPIPAANEHDSTRATCVTSYTHLKTIEQSATPSWFTLSEGLLWGLHNTDLKNTFVEHIKMPFPAFFIELPQGAVYCNDEVTGLHEARYMAIAEGTEPMWKDALLVGVFCEPNEKSINLGDDHVMDVWLPMFNPDQPLDEVIDFVEHASDIGREMAQDGRLNVHMPMTRDQAAEIFSRSSKRVRDGKAPQDDPRITAYGTIFGDTIYGREFKRAILRIATNTILYINSSGAHKRHIHQDQIDGLEKRARKKKKGGAIARNRILKTIRDLKHVPHWLLGTNIVINPEAPAAPSGERPSSSGRKLTRPSITRGHWRNQPYGPKRSLRKLKWIAPFIRGAHLGEAPAGHNYDVRP
jgi:hypothetical protein